MPKRARSSSSLVLCTHTGCPAHHLAVVAAGRPTRCSYCGKRAVAHPLAAHPRAKRPEVRS